MFKLTIRTPADIGALIRDRRKSLGLDQAELAARIGVGRLWVNQVERGKPGASLGLVLRALAAVGVELKSQEDDLQADRPPPVVTTDINAIIEARRRKPKAGNPDDD